LPDDVRKKILLVSHFRTLNNFELYTKILYDDGLLTKFERFSIGGLVIGDKTSLPVNLYTIGMLQIILGLKDNPDYKHIRFHVLGASNIKHVLFLYMLKYAIEDIFDVDISLSYDSASIFKGFQRAREIEVLIDEDYGIYKMSLKYKDLKKIIPGVNKTIEEVFKTHINVMMHENGITDFDAFKHDIYECPTCPFTEEIRFPAAIYPVYEFKRADKYLQNVAKQLIGLYKTNFSEFVLELDKTLTKLNHKGKTNYINELRDSYITSLESLPKFNTIDDLKEFMYSYSSATDKEHYTKAPTWDDLF
jgi:uncharacterized protein YihD (DUF1040 family)